MHITEFPDYDPVAADQQEVARFRISTRHFLLISYFQMKKIATLLQDKAYAAARRNEFPFDKFRRLEALMQKFL